jgi:hypothetical protein
MSVPGIHGWGMSRGSTIAGSKTPTVGWLGRTVNQPPSYTGNVNVITVVRALSPAHARGDASRSAAGI